MIKRKAIISFFLMILLLLSYVRYYCQHNNKYKVSDNSSSSTRYILVSKEKSDTLFLLNRKDILKIINIYEDRNRYREISIVNDSIIKGYRDIISIKDDIIKMVNKEKDILYNEVISLNDRNRKLSIENHRLLKKDRVNMVMIPIAFSVGFVFGVMLFVK